VSAVDSMSNSSHPFPLQSLRQWALRLP